MPRKKREVIEHRTFGVGTIKYRKTTDYGDALVVEFGSCTRTILLDGDWVNPEDARAAFDAAREEPRPKSPPQKPIRLRSEEDDGAETETEDECKDLEAHG